MDVALGQLVNLEGFGQLQISLNPCCNGCRTWTSLPIRTTGPNNVLILVVMDVALGQAPKNDRLLLFSVLILVVMDVALGQ